MSLYRGFSTVDRDFKFRLVDFELTKQDLINHFHIRRGEKLMNPSFGTTIWSMIFENMTEDLRNDIVQEVIRVARYDPRIKVQDVSVVEYEQGIQVALDILYTGTVTPVTLALEFERETQTVREI